MGDERERKREREIGVDGKIRSVCVRERGSDE
jgi:hypothetical protein